MDVALRGRVIIQKCNVQAGDLKENILGTCIHCTCRTVFIFRKAVRLHLYKGLRFHFLFYTSPRLVTFVAMTTIQQKNDCSFLSLAIHPPIIGQPALPASDCEYLIVERRKCKG